MCLPILITSKLLHQVNDSCVKRSFSLAAVEMFGLNGNATMVWAVEGNGVKETPIPHYTNHALLTIISLDKTLTIKITSFAHVDEKDLFRIDYNGKKLYSEVTTDVIIGLALAELTEV